MSSATPRYKVIEAFLLERIHSGAYPVHHQIPPEEQLARDFGVSRMTANKAIRDLVQKGYLLRQAGLGTFVTDRKAESSLHEVLNIANEVRGRGHAYSNDIICCEGHTHQVLQTRRKMQLACSIAETGPNAASTMCQRAQ